MIAPYGTDSRNEGKLQSILRMVPGFIVCLWLVSALSPTTGHCAKPKNTTPRLEANIVDDATDEPLAARVAVTDSEGKFVEIEGKHDHVQYLDKRWCYVDGSFAADDSGRRSLD